MICAEYIWIDGYQPTANLRSKTKVMDNPVSDISEIPNWGFDGSSTQQADGGDSDCLWVITLFNPFFPTNSFVSIVISVFCACSSENCELG